MVSFQLEFLHLFDQIVTSLQNSTLWAPILSQNWIWSYSIQRRCMGSIIGLFVSAWWKGLLGFNQSHFNFTVYFHYHKIVPSVQIFNPLSPQAHHALFQNRFWSNSIKERLLGNIIWCIAFAWTREVTLLQNSLVRFDLFLYWNNHMVAGSTPWHPEASCLVSELHMEWRNWRTTYGECHFMSCLCLNKGISWVSLISLRLVYCYAWKSDRLQ